jgi:LAO/AO transport system kinase
MDWQALIDQMTNGATNALARLIILVEDRAPGWREAMQRLYPHTGNAVAIGITGYPGAGKSTLTGRLVEALVESGKRVGVVAIDPSSHLSGGAFLGDRIRMNAVSNLEGVYIRSMGSRGIVGGMRAAVRDVIKLMDAFGKDLILVETIGVGQDEVDITRTAQIVLLVCAPGQGDAIQYLKAGVMEMADIYVANKSDLPEAEQMVENLRSILFQDEAGGMVGPSIVRTNALKGEGIADLVDAVEKCVAAKRLRDDWRRQRVIDDVKSLMKERLEVLANINGSENQELCGFIEDILAGEATPYALTDEMIVGTLEQLLTQHQR